MKYLTAMKRQITIGHSPSPLSDCYTKSRKSSHILLAAHRRLALGWVGQGCGGRTGHLSNTFWAGHRARHSRVPAACDVRGERRVLLRCGCSTAEHLVRQVPRCQVSAPHVPPTWGELRPWEPEWELEKHSSAHLSVAALQTRADEPSGLARGLGHTITVSVPQTGTTRGGCPA